jgi:DNA polymerase I-like protein with 3'-5' exonuclease and polymerase domains
MDAAAQIESKPKRHTIKKVFTLPDGTVFKSENVDSFFRSMVVYATGYEVVEEEKKNKKGAVTAKKLYHKIVYDPKNPLQGKLLKPGEMSPVCAKCGLKDNGAQHPFIDYAGPTNPLVTIIYDSVSRHEDTYGTLASGGSASVLKRIIHETSDVTGVTPKDVRWVPITRCANWADKLVNYKIKGNWCRYHVIQDLLLHPPNLIMPVGTQVLGLLSHKSNAQDWGGRLLTWRGWPDDWITKPDFNLPQPHPADPTKTVLGHPVMGAKPDVRIPMLPIQAPRIIHAINNPYVFGRWKQNLLDGLWMAKHGVKPNVYTRDWYRFTENIEEIEAALKDILRHPKIKLCYDTETTGLRPWGQGAAIVSMMFRWLDPATGPQSVGFPWDFEGSAVRPHMARLRPLIWKVLTQSGLIGHNLTFDVLFTYACLWKDQYVKDGKFIDWSDSAHNRQRDGLLCQLADAADYDTWHMAYTNRQQRGSLGLEAIAYDFVPDLAGYEEEMTLLIDLHADLMHPGNNKGGHYLNCPRDKWASHLVPYVMGDVEVCYRAFEQIKSKLEKTPLYKMPLAKPGEAGRFREFAPPPRMWVYQNIMSPAAKVLMKMMGRGMFVNEKELNEMEVRLPLEVGKLRDKLRDVNPNIVDWCIAKEREATAKGEEWHLDLENKADLKRILFDEAMLNLPVQRLTKGGKKLFGDTEEAFKRMSREDQLKYAAMDKWTLNRLAVDHANIRPLQEYRKAYKLYSTYVRPLRNIQAAGIDKKARGKDPHLCFDQCIHASFMLTGTRGGRLSCRDPNLQQLPRDGEVKSLYTSRFGERGCLYAADLSQIELRLMAAACGDPTMVKAYFDGIDLHSLTASRIYKIPYEQFTKEHMKWLQSNKRDKEAKDLELKRVLAKTTNFLTGYGGGAFGLQNVLANQSIYLPLEECESIIDSFFDSYPALRRLLQYYKRFILDTGVAVSIFGRVRIFEEVFGGDEEAKAKALRAGCNHLIQSTASDMMLMALHVIEQMMREEDLESLLVSTVHDSLLIDCIQSELPKVHDIVMSVLNHFDIVLPVVFGENYDTSWMLVPFSGDAEVGLDYLNTKKIPPENVDWDKLLATEEKGS